MTIYARRRLVAVMLLIAVILVTWGLDKATADGESGRGGGGATATTSQYEPTEGSDMLPYERTEDDTGLVFEILTELATNPHLDLNITQSIRSGTTSFALYDTTTGQTIREVEINSEALGPIR